MNPVPIHEIGERWIGKYERGSLRALSELKKKLEGEDKSEMAMNRRRAESRFVYVTYIRTTPEKIWQALMEPEYTRQILGRHDAGMCVEGGRVVEANKAGWQRGG